MPVAVTTQTWSITAPAGVKEMKPSQNIMKKIKKGEERGESEGQRGERLSFLQVYFLPNPVAAFPDRLKLIVSFINKYVLEEQRIMNSGGQKNPTRPGGGRGGGH